MIRHLFLLAIVALLVGTSDAGPLTYIKKCNCTKDVPQSHKGDAHIIWLSIIPANADPATPKPTKRRKTQGPTPDPIVFIPTPRPRESIKINAAATNTRAQKTGLWPNGKIPYTFAKGEFTKAQEKWIVRAMKKLQKETCLKFVRRTNERSYAKFRSNRKTCSAQMGYTVNQVKEVQISFLTGCESLGTIQHELLHLLGLRHEHSRIDRDKYIEVLWQNIEKGMEENFEIYPNERKFTMPYDLSSVLHYSGKAFSTDPFVRKTLQANGVMANRAMGQRERASQFDIAKLNIMYNCTGPSYFRAENYQYFGYVIDSRLVSDSKPKKVTKRVNFEAELAQDDEVYDDT